MQTPSSTAGGNGNGAATSGMNGNSNEKGKDGKKPNIDRADGSRDTDGSKDGLNSHPYIYQLPDGNLIDVREEGDLDIANMLFENHPTDKSQCALSNLAFDAVSACDVDCRREMFNGIVLTGGTSLIPGTMERFTRELAVLTPQPYKLKVLGSPNTIERTAGPWIGGSIVASLGNISTSMD